MTNKKNSISSAKAFTEEVSAFGERIEGNVKDAYGAATGGTATEREGEYQVFGGAQNRRHYTMLTGLFNDRESAEHAYSSLESRGYNRDDVNLLMSDETRDRHFGEGTADTELGSKALEGAGAGSVTGGTLGAIIGGIAAIGTNVLLPGLGVVVAGPIAAALTGAGGLTGGLVGALIGSGIPEDRAVIYNEGIRNGGIVFAVTPRNEEDAIYFQNEWRSSSGQYIYPDYSAHSDYSENYYTGEDSEVSFGNQTSEESGESSNTSILLESPEYKQIIAWISEISATPNDSLIINTAYTLNFKVGSEQATNLITAESAKIPNSDIPDEGLDTEWVITTKSVRLHSIYDDVAITISKISGADMWNAKFSLHVPKSEDSSVKQVRIIPLISENAELQIIIFAKHKMYRQFTVELNVKSPEKKTIEPAAKITNEVIFSPANELNIRPTQEWLTPTGTLKIAVLKGDNGAYVSGEVVMESGGIGTVDTSTEWYARNETVNPLINKLREAAKNFCNTVEFNTYLNDILPDELINRLKAAAEANVKGSHSFAYDGNADVKHLSTWNSKVAPSVELQRVASFGYLIYDTIFPVGSELREWLDLLPSSWRIDISWSENSGSAYIPNIPWGMLYSLKPEANQPIDATRFFGLRFRLDYTAYSIKKPKSKALGEDREIHKAGCFYWGNQLNDVVAVESQWQQNQWKDWTNQKFIPGSVPENQMSMLLSFLQDPAPNPLRFLYFYCHCRVSDDTVGLRFGKGNQPTDLVDQLGLGLSPIADQPLVFVNACSSASGDAYGANQLIETFMRRRDCRAFIGTEIDMPVVLASRFALVFSYFFFRRITTRKITAGEACYQAKLFLWHHYRNIGGIFYTYINEYDLFMASPDEP